MEELSSPEYSSFALPTLTTPISTTPLGFALPSNVLQLYFTNTPVNTNELCAKYHVDDDKFTPTWQKIHPINPFVPHALPEIPMELLQLQQLQQSKKSEPQVMTTTTTMTVSSNVEWPQLALGESNGCMISSPMDIDYNNEHPLQRPIARPYNYCSRESSVQSDHSNHSEHQKQSSPSTSPNNRINKKRGVSPDEKAERRKKGNTESQARSRWHNKIIKDLYEKNDKLIEEINLIYLKNRHNDPLINKLLTNYQRLPKKERPYKKRAPSSSINESV